MMDATKISDIENDFDEKTLEKRFDLKTFDEFKYFALEICDMVDEGKEIDLDKAARNAKYLAEISRSIENIKAGKGVTFTFEELERLINV